MSLGATLERLAEAMGPKNESITDHDLELAQIELDPELTKCHPGLFRFDEDKISTEVDSVYIAASAGSPYARFLILAAAHNQVRSAGQEIKADGEETIAVKDLIDFYTNYDLESEPLEREEAIAMLDSSLALIELAIEDAKIYPDTQ